MHHYTSSPQSSISCTSLSCTSISCTSISCLLSLSVVASWDKQNPSDPHAPPWQRWLSRTHSSSLLTQSPHSGPLSFRSDHVPLRGTPHARLCVYASLFANQNIFSERTRRRGEGKGERERESERERDGWRWREDLETVAQTPRHT